MNNSELADELVNKPTTEAKDKLQVVLPPRLMGRLVYLSEEMGINKTELVKRILSEWFEKNYEDKMNFWVGVI